MPTYCKLGDTHVFINYSFGGGTSKTVKINNAPIEVTTASKTVGRSPNYKKEGYEITFYSPNNGRSYTITILDHIVTYYPGYVNSGGYTVGNYYGIAWRNCQQPNFNRNLDGSLNGPEVDPNSITTNYAVQCPIPDPSNVTATCSIEAKYNGSLILQDSGDCPVNYSVTCNEECPPGTVKCLSNNYPGYCCLPCEPTKASIRAITDIVRRINHG